MIQKKGKCSSCGGFYYIANKKYNLCFRCNSIRNAKNKIKEQKENGIYQSETDVYHLIWDTRPQRCELTGECLRWTYGTEIWYSCFAHLYPKGKFPQWKYLPENILLVHPDVHHCLDNGTHEQQLKMFGEAGLKRILLKKKKVLETKKGLS